MAPNVVVKAGTSYTGPFIPVTVNSAEPVELTGGGAHVKLAVRINEYGAAPSEYFEHKERAEEQFSIQFAVEFAEDVNGDRLVWGNDFDEPVRDILPWGFSAAFKAFKWSIDPSVFGDVYADKPYLYGPVLTSVNYIDTHDSLELAVPLEEGLESSPAWRRKKYLDRPAREKFVFHKDTAYDFDFVTPYLKLGDGLAVKLPGFTFDVGKYANIRDLRYVLKNGDDVVFCVVISIAA